MNSVFNVLINVVILVVGCCVGSLAYELFGKGIDTFPAFSIGLFCGAFGVTTVNVIISMLIERVDLNEGS